MFSVGESISNITPAIACTGTQQELYVTYLIYRIYYHNGNHSRRIPQCSHTQYRYTQQSRQCTCPGTLCIPQLPACRLETLNKNAINSPFTLRWKQMRPQRFVLHFVGAQPRILQINGHFRKYRLLKHFLRIRQCMVGAYIENACCVLSRRKQVTQINTYSSCLLSVLHPLDIRICM